MIASYHITQILAKYKKSFKVCPTAKGLTEVETKLPILNMKIQNQWIFDQLHSGSNLFKIPNMLEIAMRWTVPRHENGVIFII